MTDVVGHSSRPSKANEAPANCLVILAKSARPGRVKTRLIGELTAEQAADLHSAFLDDLIEEMLGSRFALRVAWALQAGEDVPACAVKSLRQSGGGLGERLHEALAELAGDYTQVAAVGSDHPELTASLVQRAFDKLADGAEVVLGPADDGGYYLVALRSGALRREIFDGIPWSSQTVLRTTLERCEELGLHVDLLPVVPDVDTPGDLARLIATLDRGPSHQCPRTRALLRTWRRLGRSDSEGTKHEDS